MSAQDGSDVSVEVATEGAEGSNGAPKPTDEGAAEEVTITSQPWCGLYAVPSQDFTAATVGEKSLNTVRLQVLSMLVLAHALIPAHRLLHITDAAMLVRLPPS